MHEKYRDMDEWSGSETADIVYEDCAPDRKLTGFLLKYLLPGYSLRERENIKYYLEVKTTIGDCSNKFFLSKAQHLRVRICVLPWSTDHKLIYSRVDEENGPGTRDPSKRSLCDHAGLQSWSKEYDDTVLCRPMGLESERGIDHRGRVLHSD